MNILNNLCFRRVNLKCLKPQTITKDAQEFINYRLWNRDLAAVLNFGNIVFSLPNLVM